MMSYGELNERDVGIGLVTHIPDEYISPEMWYYEQKFPLWFLFFMVLYIIPSGQCVAVIEVKW